MKGMVFILTALLPEVLFGFVSWCRVYSLGGNESGSSGVDIGSRIYVVGNINDANDAILLKIDSVGNVISHKVYNFGYNYEFFNKVKHFPADNTLFALGMAGPRIGERYAVIMKVDTLLNTVWWVGERVAGTWSCCGTNYYTDLFWNFQMRYPLRVKS